jgi:DNA-binding NarL/FixJ family response regulator
MPGPKTSSRHTFEITPRRAAVIRYMMRDGQKLNEIARELGCSVGTIQRHLDSKSPRP